MTLVIVIETLTEDATLDVILSGNGLHQNTSKKPHHC